MSILKTLIEKRGLWDNIHAKRKRIKAGSGERMRKPGSKGAPTDADFKAAQNEETELDEAVTVDKKNYSWGKMVTVHHGSENSYPLHPEHQAAIKKLKDGEHTSFTDETKRKVTAKREGDKVHLSGAGSNKKTTVAHSHFNEEVEQIDELKKSTVKSYMNKKVNQINKDADLQYPFKPKPITKKEAGKNAENLMRGHARLSGVKPTSEELDVKDTDDYKLSKSGKKMKAHKIVFNKGEEENKKGVSEQMKKSYKDFVEHHTLDLTEEQKNEIVAELQEVLGKDAKAADWISDFVHSDNPKFAGKSKEKRKQMALAAYYAKQRNEGIEMEEELKGNQHKLDKNKNGKLDKHDFKLLRKEEEVKESVFDWKGKPSKLAPDSSKTRTMHDVKKTSTGTEYTKQRDADGISKEFKRDPEEAKRGRGRPKKNKFAEAAEFLIGLDEETFDSFMEEGFDVFLEQFEQLDEISKATLGSYVKKATKDAVVNRKIAADFENQADKSRKPSMKAASTSLADKYKSKSWKRQSNISKAVDRLTK